MYLPKSKYSIKQASKGKFIYLVSKKDFEGEYILLSNGTMFAGNQTLNIKGDTRIIPRLKGKKDNTYILHNDLNNVYFNNLLNSKKISKDQDNLNPLINSKPPPLEKDYVKGYFYRYFAKRRNSDNHYYEVNKKTHESIKNEEGKYDDYLHISKKIKWSLSDNSGKNNNLEIRKIVKTTKFKRLKSFFKDLEEYHLSNEILNPKITPENINAPKMKLPLNNRKTVVEAQQGAIDIIKEKSRKRYNKSSGNGNSSTSSSGGGGGGY